MISRILIWSLFLVPVLSSNYETKNAEHDVVTDILLDIRTYMEHLPQVTALAERLASMEMALKKNDVKLATLETSLVSKSEELVELRALTKLQDAKILECSVLQRQGATKSIEMESRFDVEAAKVAGVTQTQEKLIDELGKRLRKLEDEEIAQIAELKVMKETILEGEENAQELKSAMLEFTNLLQGLDKGEIATKTELKKAEDKVSDLQSKYDDYEESETGLSKRLQALESLGAAKNVSLASIGGRIDALEEFVHTYHRKNKAISLCPLPYSKVGQDCLLLKTKKESWDDARFRCKEAAQKIGGEGDLAMPTDTKAFKKYIKQLDIEDMYLWVGATDAGTEGKWRWVTGELVDLTDFPWDHGEPDANSGQNYLCVTTQNDANYHDCINAASLAFICQLY